MSTVIADVPTVIGDGILDRLTQQAQTIIDTRDHNEDRVDPDARDRRGIDEVRADVFADLLLAGAPALDPQHTAMGRERSAPSRARAGHRPRPHPPRRRRRTRRPRRRHPIDADAARSPRREHPWARILAEAVDGTVLAVDRYRTPWPQRRFLQARDQHCRWPVHRHQLRNRPHHRRRQRRPHRPMEPRPPLPTTPLDEAVHTLESPTTSGGILEWTSPTGRIYREDAPAPPVAFIPAYTGDAPLTRRPAAPQERIAAHTRRSRRSSLAAVHSPKLAPDVQPSNSADSTNGV